MLKNRIIPCLDIRDGRTVKGIQFEDIKDAGSPIALAQRYVNESADELVFLDISATLEKRKTLTNLVMEVAQKVNIPFTVGGGIKTVEDAKALLQAGADKISVNSSAITNPSLISELANELGKQCVVLAIDTKYEAGEWQVYSHGGTQNTKLSTIEWAKLGAQLGAGEILLTSMNNDGLQNGYALDITEQIAEAISIPIIASGGAGNEEHFKELFTQTRATGALAASIFHYGAIAIPKLKQYLKQQNIPIR